MTYGIICVLCYRYFGVYKMEPVEFINYLGLGAGAGKRKTSAPQTMLVKIKLVVKLRLKKILNRYHNNSTNCFLDNLINCCSWRFRLDFAAWLHLLYWPKFNLNSFIYFRRCGTWGPPTTGQVGLAATPPSRPAPPGATPRAAPGPPPTPAQMPP